MKKSLFGFSLSLVLAGSAMAQFSLSNYQVSSTVTPIYPGNSEASGVTFSADTGRLYVVEDEGNTLYELSTSGTVISTMSMSGFADVEGITYIGGGQFLLTEERDQDIFRFTYSGGGSLVRSSLPTYSFGPTVGNIGLEGISYDFVNNIVFGVKEKTSQAIYSLSGVNFATMTGSLTSFTPSLGLSDLSDIQVLNTVPGLIGSGHENNLLVLSQESARLLEVTRAGAIVSSFDLSAYSGTIEGVTIGTDGTIYLVSEDPQLITLTAIPEPSTYALIFGAAALGLAVWRRQARSTATATA